MIVCKNLCVFIVVFIYFTGYHEILVSCDFGSPPQIINVKENITLQPGDNFTLICEGQHSLTWDIPTNWSSKVDIFPEENNSLSGTNKYNLQLKITNISYLDVGFYYCFYKDNRQLKSGVYLYVNDSEHLSINGNSEGSLPIITVTQFDTAVIPCRPTSPDVEVELRWFNGEKNNALYDPKTGFSFNVTDLSYEDMYSCFFSKDSKTEELLFHLSIRSPLEHLDLPVMNENSTNHTVVGEKLIIECKVRVHINTINFNWSTPTGTFNAFSTSDRITFHPMEVYEDIDGNGLKQDLIIENATLEDKGNYSCIVSDLQGHSSATTIFVYVYDINERLPIEMTEENNQLAIAVLAGREVQWRIDVIGHPKPSLFWRNNIGDIITDSSKYTTKFLHNQAFLRIHDLTLSDFGNFTLEANNTYDSQRLALFLNVSGEPSVTIKGSNYVIVNSEVWFTCNVLAYPKPQIIWSFKPCAKEENCHTELKTAKYEVTGDPPKGAVSYLSLNATENGYLTCSAKNDLGVSREGIQIYTTDVKNGLDIFDIPDTIILENKHKGLIAVGDQLRVTCGTSWEGFKTPEWFFNNEPLKTDNRHFINYTSTMYSKRNTLTISNVSPTDQGIYNCIIQKNNTAIPVVDNISLALSVSEPFAPEITETNLTSNIEWDYPAPLTLSCEYKGLPKPQIRWYKNNELIEIQDSGRIIFSANSDSIKIPITDADEDEGRYKCEVENSIGRTYRASYLTFKNKKANATWYLILTGILLLLLLIVTLYMILRIRKEKMKRRRLWEQFKNGNVDAINPELGVNDQAILLPYVDHYEFPQERLKLGKLLGSGAFGCVYKGEAKNLKDDEAITTVAVKTIVKTTDTQDPYFKALESELKIMIHMGKHLNVLNLLGACTKNYDKGELYIIVEYCRYGNLQNYLLKHRHMFIDQTDPVTREIDLNIGSDILERSYSVSSGTSSPLLKCFPDSSSVGLGPDYRAATFTGDSTQGEEPQMLSNNSLQPGWRSNYRGDYNGQVVPICTKDLLVWAFQVARGMEYLSSRKILHSDLAARNILLADGNVVKICDFGLAKSMQQNDIYKKTTNNPMPIKWMALESLEDKDFSTKSDVWSFGIVLWEFFSLGRTPYPGLDAESVYEHLKVGYRMECPEYSPQKIYKIMRDCWNTDPNKRPTFTKLQDLLGSLLSDQLRRYYLALNDPYLLMNIEKKEEGLDYLAMLTPPEFENSPMTPHYINQDVLSPHKTPIPEDSEGYLCMSPNIFSPRIANERVFDFNNRKNRSSAEGHPHETLPMLQLVQEKSSDNINSPTTTNSFSNPSYHIPPNISEKNVKNISEPIGSKDNYITMPQYKNIVNNKDLNDKDKLEIENEHDKVHYVNDFIKPSVQI